MDEPAITPHPQEAPLVAPPLRRAGQGRPRPGHRHRRQHRRGDDRGQDGHRHRPRASTGRRSPPCCPTASGRTVLLDVGANVDSKPVHLRAVRRHGPLLRPGGDRHPLAAHRPDVDRRGGGQGDRPHPRGLQGARRRPASTSSATSRGGTSSTARSTSSSATASSATSVLKSAEALAELIGSMLARGDARRARAASSATPLAKPAFDRFRERTDYSEYGAAPLLGRQRRLLHRPRPLERPRHPERHPPARPSSRARARRKIETSRRAAQPGGALRPAPSRRMRGQHHRHRHAVPEQVLTNADLERMVDTERRWILDPHGIRERRIAAPRRVALDLRRPGRRARPRDGGASRRGRRPVICATVTPDTPFPATANLIQDRIGATRAAAFDLSAGCTGSSTPWRRRAVHRERLAKTVLVVGGEMLSRDRRLDRPQHLRPLRRRRRRGGAPGDRGGRRGILGVRHAQRRLARRPHLDARRRQQGSALARALESGLPFHQDAGQRDLQDRRPLARRGRATGRWRAPGLAWPRRPLVHPPPGQPAHHRRGRRAPGDPATAGPTSTSSATATPRRPRSPSPSTSSTAPADRARRRPPASPPSAPA